MYHCMHCGNKLHKEDIAPRECPDNEFLDKLAKLQWELFGGSDGTIYLCPRCSRITPILGEKQIERFINYMQKGKELMERAKEVDLSENEYKITTQQDENTCEYCRQYHGYIVKGIKGLEIQMQNMEKYCNSKLGCRCMGRNTKK